MAIGQMNSDEKQKTVLKVTGEIRSRILDETFPPGMPLSQVHIAEALGVSRTPIREALQILSAEDLVEISPTGRAVVSVISPDDMLERLELRTLIECKLLELAIPLMLPAGIRETRELSRSLETCSPDEWMDANYRFHERLYRPANRPVMQKFVKQLYYLHLTRLRPLIVSRRNSPRSLREHDELIDRCEAGNIERARDLLESHIMLSGYALIDHLKSIQKQPHR